MPLHPDRDLGGFSLGGDGAKHEPSLRVRVRLAVQMLFPTKSGRLLLLNQLQTIPHPDSSQALAKVALYAPEESIREMAIQALRVRRLEDFENVLVSGLRYPLPRVAENAADAICRLGLSARALDGMPEILTWRDPRQPIGLVGERLAPLPGVVVSEVVKIPHHRNCALCHPPARPSHPPRFASVPVRNETPMLAPNGMFTFGRDYGNSAAVRLAIRFDQTFLRQDFSLVEPSNPSDPHSPAIRFDYVVRERDLSDHEARLAESHFKMKPPHYWATLRVLRKLTGKDDSTNDDQWRAHIRKLLDRSEDRRFFSSR
jgi:hypothetical protein